MNPFTPELDLVLTAAVFALGACVGSFLNVCIVRIPAGQSVVFPRSHCPVCETPIAWYDNIPLVSYLALKGRCRNCREPIAARYYLVELLTAVLFCATWLRYGWDARTVVFWIVEAGLLAGSAIDLEHMILPDRITLGGMAVGLAASALVPSLQGSEDRLAALVRSASGLALGTGALWLVSILGRALFRKEAMGLGDVKLLGALGAFLGVQAVLFTIFFSALLGSVIGTAFILAGQKKWQSRIPFGPYIAAAAVVWIFPGQTWWRAYFDWLLAVR